MIIFYDLFMKVFVFTFHKCYYKKLTGAQPLPQERMHLADGLAVNTDASQILVFREAHAGNGI